MKQRLVDSSFYSLRPSFVTLAVTLGFLLSLVSSSNAFGQIENNDGSPVLLQNLRIIVGNGAIIPEASILIVEDSITAVAGNGSITLPAGTVTIDLQGKTAMPALIDAHAHLGYDAVELWGAQNYGLDNLIENLNRYAYYGFSAVLSAGSDPDDLALQLQQLQRDGVVEGTRFLFAAGMAPPGQGPNNQFLEQALIVEQQTGMIILRGLADETQARVAVQQVAAKQIEFIKIWVDDRGGTQQKLTPNVYRAVMAAATEFGIDVLVHQQFASDMPQLVDAGVAGFLHGRLESGFTESIAASAAASGVFIVPNLGLGELRREAIGGDPFLARTLPSSVIQRLGSSAQRMATPMVDAQVDQTLRNSFTLLLENGVAVVLGTDAGALPDHPFGYSGHRELEIYVRLGMTPLQAINAGTSAAAVALGLENLGLIAPGYSADLLILDQDPSQDIRNTRSINAVYLRGKAIDREALAESFRAGAGIN